MERSFINQVQEERKRQIINKGFDAVHDDHYIGGELGQAAACYAMPHSARLSLGAIFKKLWPWPPHWWKPANFPNRPQARQREIIKAAALLYAEWDRLERQLLKIEQPPHVADTLADMEAAGAITEPEILPMEPGQPGYGGYDPNNPPPDPEPGETTEEFNERVKQHLDKLEKIDQGELANKCGWPRPGSHNPDNPEPEPEKIKQTYNERVQAIAEKMAADDLKECVFKKIADNTADDWLKKYYAQKVKANMEKARIAVAEMAYVYTLANLPHYHFDATMLASGIGRINREMKELGLIPDEGQEAGDNG